MLNALVYGLSPEVRDTIRNAFAPICPVCCAAGDPDERKVLSGSGQPSGVNRTRLEDELDSEAGGKSGRSNGGGSAAGRGGNVPMYEAQDGAAMGFQVQRTDSFAEPSDLDAVLDGEDDDDIGIRVTSPVIAASRAIPGAAAASSSTLGGRASSGRSEVEMSDRGDASYRSGMSGVAGGGEGEPGTASLPTGRRHDRTGSDSSARD